MNMLAFVASLILGMASPLSAQYGAARLAADPTSADAVKTAPVDLKQNLAATVNLINQRLMDVTQLPMGQRTPQAILKPFEEMRTYLRQMGVLSNALVQNHSDKSLESLGEHYKGWTQALETRIFSDPMYERLLKSTSQNTALSAEDHASLTDYVNKIRRQASASPGPRTTTINPKLPEKLLAQARELFGHENAKKLEVLPQDIVSFVTQPRADSEKILGSVVNIGMFKKALPLLPPRQLQVFTLHYINRLSHDEISKQLGISLNTSRGTIRDARQKLEKSLQIDVLPGHPVAESDQKSGEKEVIASAQSGDETASREAIGFLYERYYKRIYSVILRIVNKPEDAEDLAQDVFMKLPEKIKQFREEAAFSTWLHRVAVNEALGKLRKKSVPIAYSLDDPVTNAEGGADSDAGKRGDFIKDPREEGPEANLIRREEEEALQKNIKKTLNKLPPGQRKILLWHDRDDLTHQQIAKKLGITDGGSKSQLARVRRKFEDLFGHDGDTPDNDVIEAVPSEVSEAALAAP